MKIDAITGEEFVSDDEQIKAFMDSLREYQASVTPERFEMIVELMKDIDDGRTPIFIAAQIEQH